METLGEWHYAGDFQSCQQSGYRQGRRGSAEGRGAGDPSCAQEPSTKARGRRCAQGTQRRISSNWRISSRRNAEEFAKLETLNNGKPLREARYDVADAAGCFRYYAGLITKPLGQTFRSV